MFRTKANKYYLGVAQIETPDSKLLTDQTGVPSPRDLIKRFGVGGLQTLRDDAQMMEEDSQLNRPLSIDGDDDILTINEKMADMFDEFQNFKPEPKPKPEPEPEPTE